MTLATERVPTRAAITLLDPTSLPLSGTPVIRLGANRGELAGFGVILNVSAPAAPAIPGRTKGDCGG